MAKEQSNKRRVGKAANAGRARAAVGRQAAAPGGAGVARSQEELAAVHGVSRQAVGKWVRDPRWRDAGFRVEWPWGAAEIARQKEWRRDVLRERTDGGGGRASPEGEAVAGTGPDVGRAKSIAQLKLLVAKEESLRLEMDIRRGVYIKRVESDEKLAQAFRAMRLALMQLPKALRQLLADTTDSLVTERLLEEALRRVCVEGFGKE